MMPPMTPPKLKQILSLSVSLARWDHQQVEAIHRQREFRLHSREYLERRRYSRHLTIRQRQPQ